MDNGDLLDAVEEAGYEVLITTDKNISHQQNLSGKALAVLVLPSPRWPTLESRAKEIMDVLAKISPRDFVELP